MLKVITLSDLLLKLEDAGEVAVEIAEHTTTKGNGGDLSLAPKNAVAFVLDPIKDEKKKKKKKAQIACTLFNICT